MNSDLLILGAVTGLALWFSRRSKSDQAALEAKALDALGKNSPNIAISNVEAIEERRVFVFQPVAGELKGGQVIIRGAMSDRFINQNQPFDFLDLWTKGVRFAPYAPNQYPLKSAAVVRMDGKGGSVPLVPGAFYSLPPAIGDLSFGSYRMRIDWVENTFSGGPKPEPVATPMSAFLDVPAEIWGRCFTVRIATVAEQVQAGGVVEVGPEFKP